MKIIHLLMTATALTILAACGPKSEPQGPSKGSVDISITTPENEPAVEVENESGIIEPTINWSVIGDGSISKGATIELNLIKGPIFAVLPDTAVEPGDKITTTMTLASEEPTDLRVVLMRHCNSDQGDESKVKDVNLSTTPTSFSVEHTFAQSFSCIRLVFRTLDADPATIFVDNMKVFKQ